MAGGFERFHFDAPDEVTFARGRLPSRIYVSRSFPMAFGVDQGQPARYIQKVFDEVENPDEAGWDWTSEVVFVTPGGRKQLTLNVARESGAVRKLRIQKVPTDVNASKLEPVLELDREQAVRLIDMLKAIDSIPIEGEASARVDDQVLRDVFSDPEGVNRVYTSDPELFRSLIETDANARDVIALQRRRDVAEAMRRWMEEPAAFDEAKRTAGGPEAAWQHLLEANPWILGAGLGSQLVTSWNDEKLEQVVAGRHIGGVGKRTDALMRTAGAVRSMVFAEIKHHHTDLLSKEYRPGCWRPSDDLSGAVVQVQQTVHLAVNSLTDYLPDQDDDGAMLPSGTFLLSPRSFVIIGSLDELTGNSGGPIRDKVRSFELFRRNIRDPEIVTFDELLARAEWHVKLAEEQSFRGAREGEGPPVDDDGVRLDEAPF